MRTVSGIPVSNNSFRPLRRLMMMSSSACTACRRALRWGGIVVLLAVAVSCASSGETAAPPWKTDVGYVLRPRFEEGSSYTVETAMDQTMEMGMMGQSIEMEQEQSFVHRYDVRDRAADGAITLDYTATRIQGKTSMPALGRTMRYDSDDTTASGRAGQMSRRMRSMVGHTITAQLAPKGSVRAVTGVEAVVDSFAAAQQDSIQAQLFRRMLGPDAVRQQLNISFGLYPDRPVTVGDTWSTQSAVRLGVPMQIEAVYALDSIRNDRAIIDAEMQLSPLEDDSTMQMGGMSVNMRLSGTMDGTILLDLPSGLPEKSDLDLEMSGTGTVERGVPSSGPSMEMEMTSEGTVVRSIRPMDEKE